MSENNINGLPSFKVDVNLTLPNENDSSIGKRLQSRLGQDMSDFYNFNEDFYEILQDFDFLQKEDKEKLMYTDYKPSKYYIAHAKIVSGPTDYQGYKFNYPVELKGIDFNDPKLVTPDIGLINSDNKEADVLNSVAQVINSLLFERTILKYAIVVNAFLDGEKIFTETIEKDELT